MRARSAADGFCADTSMSPPQIPSVVVEECTLAGLSTDV